MMSVSKPEFAKSALRCNQCIIVHYIEKNCLEMEKRRCSLCTCVVMYLITTVESNVGSSEFFFGD
jgi:hypothetical protein